MCNFAIRLTHCYKTAFFSVGWKPMLYWLFGPKNPSFRNKSGKTQPIRTKFGIRGQVNGRQRSGNFGRDRPILAKMEAGTRAAEAGVFIARQHTDARYWYSKSVHLSVCNVPISDENGLTYRHSFSPYGSPIILVLPASNIFTKFRRDDPLRGR